MWAAEPGRETYDAVVHALKTGYRHIDTAQVYRNEGRVGAALQASPVPREAIFLVTKIAPKNLAPRALRRSAIDSLGRGTP